MARERRGELGADHVQDRVLEGLLRRGGRRLEAAHGGGELLGFGGLRAGGHAVAEQLLELRERVWAGLTDLVGSTVLLVAAAGLLARASRSDAQDV